MVLSVSKGSAGYVAARGTVNLSPTTMFGDSGGTYGTKYGDTRGADYTGSISGGTTDLTVKEYSAKLVNATTLSCDGPVEWQVIEYR